MQIKSIKLENIRSYDQQEIVFPKGSTILAGDIGSGKTSVLLGIEFALFGLQPGQKGSSLLRNGKDQGSVILKIEVNGKEILIERRLKRTKSVNQSYASITIDNETKEMSVSELKNLILQLLSYPQEFAKKTNMLYKFTVYTPQEEMKQIILENPETRMNTLRHIFGVDKYKRIQENSQHFLSKLREKVRHYEGQLDNLETLNKQREQKKENLSQLHAELEEIRQEFARQKNIWSIIEKDMQDIEKKIKEKEKYEHEADRIRIMILGREKIIGPLEVTVSDDLERSLKVTDEDLCTHSRTAPRCKEVGCANPVE